MVPGSALLDEDVNGIAIRDDLSEDQKANIRATTGRTKRPPKEPRPERETLLQGQLFIPTTPVRKRRGGVNLLSDTQTSDVEVGLKSLPKTAPAIPNPL